MTPLTGFSEVRWVQIGTGKGHTHKNLRLGLNHIPMKCSMMMWHLNRNTKPESG